MTMITFTRDDECLAIIEIAHGNQAARAFAPQFVAELDAAVTRLAQDDALTGAILILGHQGDSPAESQPAYSAVPPEPGLSAADISDQLQAVSRVLRRLETCRKPVVAALRGTTLGPGYELALACHYRILLNDPAARIGLPQVRLGLMPALGGSQRLPRLISLPKALPLLLGGRSLAPEAALASGLVEELADSPGDLMARARAWCLSGPPALQPWDVKGFRMPGGAGPLAPFATREFQNGTSRLKAGGGATPAPRAILSAVYEGTLLPIDRALKIEADFCATLLCDPVTGRSLDLALRRDAALRAARANAAPPIRRLGLSGTAGIALAARAAAAGVEVVLSGTGREAFLRAVDECAQSEGPLAGPGTGASAEITEAQSPAAIADCDLILEGEPSSDSWLSVKAILREPEGDQTLTLRHGPRSDAPLAVEVICAEDCSPAALARLQHWLGKLDILPLPVLRGGVALADRVAAALDRETQSLLVEGVPVALIRNAARQAGFALMPPQAADAPPPASAAARAETQAARANAEARRPTPAPGEVVRRLIAVAEREVALCLSEGVLPDAETARLALVYAAGVPVWWTDPGKPL